LPNNRTFSESKHGKYSAKPPLPRSKSERKQLGTQADLGTAAPRNVGFAFSMKAGQSVQITSQSIIDFVGFNRDNLRERSDQARTKANQTEVFFSTGGHARIET
jgi:hypothetical protein